MGSKYQRTHHLHAMLSLGLFSGWPRRQPPRKAAGAVWWFTASVGPLRYAAGGHSPRRSHERLEQMAGSPNCSSGWICVAWGKSSALRSYSSASKPKATHLDTTPLCNPGDREAVPVASQAGWCSRGRISSGSQAKHMMVPSVCLMCFGLLYVQWEALTSAGNQSLAVF